MPFLAVVFIKDARTAKRKLGQWEASGYKDQGFKIVGLYKWPQPTKLCGGFCGPTGWKRRSDGVIVHTCGGRNSRWKAFIRGWFFDMFGKNYVKNAPAVFRTPDGY